LHTKSADDDALLNSLIVCIAAINCAEHFASHIGQVQNEQTTIVRHFQKTLGRVLASAFPDMTWSIEHKPNPPSRDSIDIFGQANSALVVIELDKHRADQVAKKFVSRSAMFEEKKIHYISLCYPGTQGMSASECVKYFDYCAVLSKRLGNVYAGFVIEKT
jgi:hypothetical protein